ncbi:hypothetical protein [Catellatospora sp. NPDC049133]|uniref:hypothetical protein n=1 Tax=Catellatospora sp. NPDC049133 TaxID=3155499 RepID=UPI0033FE9E48
MAVPGGLAPPRDELGIFSRVACVNSWLAAERGLALSQAANGVIDMPDAQAIVAAADAANIDEEILWSAARNVGYPILGLVREIGRSVSDYLCLPEGVRRFGWGRGRVVPGP